VKFEAKGGEEKVAGALYRLTEEDPGLTVGQDEATREMVVSGLGSLHLEITVERIRRRIGIDCRLGPPHIAYKETITRKVTGVEGKHKKQSGGHGQFGVCYIDMEPLPRGGGFVFEDAVVGGAVPRQFIPSVEKGARAQLEKGVLAGYPCVDVRVTLVDGKAHSVDSSDMAFQTAAAQALREAANESTVALLEPIDAVDITVADDALGSVLADLRGRRGQVHGTEPADLAGYTVVHAEIPQHELSRYPIDLRSVSHGTGTFTRSFVRYDYMPAALAREMASQV
jgi:elongation factor G